MPRTVGILALLKFGKNEGKTVEKKRGETLKHNFESNKENKK